MSTEPLPGESVGDDGVGRHSLARGFHWNPNAGQRGSSTSPCPHTIVLFVPFQCPLHTQLGARLGPDMSQQQPSSSERFPYQPLTISARGVVGM